ncbi:MAG TPA: protein kinase [Pseudomonadota bacterium]|nr:protein kinase [Pseudomonadota bacterium]HNO69898.1 protein kinase [Pseudomonadota bacterium]
MAAPLFRRGDVIGQKYYVLTKSGEAALWVGFLACSVELQKAAEERGEVPEPDLLVKVVRPELLESPGAADKLIRHLQSYKDLAHPFLTQVVDVVALPEQGTVAITEIAQIGQGGQGVFLDRMAAFRQKEGLPLSDVLQIIDQLAESLTFLHEQGRYHGDLRLDSVLLKTDGIRLGDVGLGVGLPREPFLLQLGTVGQMEAVAPELHAARPADIRTDVFGLAKVMRSLLELGDNWTIIRDANQSLVHAISRAMATDPAERHPTIAALIADLEKALQPEGSSLVSAPGDEKVDQPSTGSSPGSADAPSNDSAGFRSSRSSIGPEFPPGSVLVSWRAFAATVVLAAVVGALLAVAVMLLRRSQLADGKKAVTAPPITVRSIPGSSQK